MPEPVAPAEGNISRRRAFRPFLWAAIAIVAVFLTAAVGGGIYAHIRYNQVVSLGKEAEADYAKLEETYPFTPPSAPSEAPPDSRYLDMMEVRQQAFAALTPMAKIQLAKLLELKSLKEVDPVYLMKLLPLGRQLKAVVDEHLAALKAHSMSAEEYRWLLSQSVYEVLKESRKEPPEQAAHWRVLEVAENLSRTDDNARNDMKAQDVVDRIEQEIGQWRNRKHPWSPAWSRVMPSRRCWICSPLPRDGRRPKT